MNPTVPDVQQAKARFLAYWQGIYPESPPIAPLFKSRLSKRWARIHSLPESKRYADIKAEWDVLLDRQNRVIDSLVEQHTPIRIVINFIDSDCYLFQSFNLENLGVFVDEDGEAEYQSFSFETTWESHTLNPILMMIAFGDLRAFIIAPDCLIAPYDGGVDVILKDAHTCWEFRRRFKGWLSKRPDGLKYASLLSNKGKVFQPPHLISSNLSICNRRGHPCTGNLPRNNGGDCTAL